jgi:RNA polymerase sigma-70 factor (ECF subfamily)
MNRDDSGTDVRRRFGSLCESLRPDLLRFAYWLGRDRQLAEDVVQEALLRAWKSLDSLTDESKAKSWLLTIVRREFARSFERKRLEVSDLDALVAAEADVLAAEDDDDLVQMREALFRLEDDYREPLVLQVMMGYTTQEIADAMGMQRGAVLTRLFRARARLRRELGLAAEPAP